MLIFITNKGLYFTLFSLLIVSLAYSYEGREAIGKALYAACKIDNVSIAKDCKPLSNSALPIYIYTDFGGGKNQRVAVSDPQTAYELASEAWSVAGQKELYINDSGKPLSPEDAREALAKTFPYDKNMESTKIQKIVVHVIDPGVENDSCRNKHHLRCAALRAGKSFLKCSTM